MIIQLPLIFGGQPPAAGSHAGTQQTNVYEKRFLSGTDVHLTDRVSAMTEPTAAPEYLAKRFVCPRCKAFAGQDWHILNAQSGHGFQPIKDRILVGTSREFAQLKGGGLDWHASQCASCEQLAIWLNHDMVYPQDMIDTGVPDPAVEMPADAKELYQEAAATLAVSRRAAAALCRAALEKLAIELTPSANPKARLDDRLALLSLDVSQPVWEVLQAVRHVGNTALHGQDDTDESIRLYLDDTDPELPRMFFEAMNMLVDERIVRPSRAAALFAKLPQGVQEVIHRKRQSQTAQDG
jgi:hypothetical protein